MGHCCNEDGISLWLPIDIWRNSSWNNPLNYILESIWEMRSSSFTKGPISIHVSILLHNSLWNLGIHLKICFNSFIFIVRGSRVCFPMLNLSTVISVEWGSIKAVSLCATLFFTCLRCICYSIVHTWAELFTYLQESLNEYLRKMIEKYTKQSQCTCEKMNEYTPMTDFVWQWSAHIDINLQVERQAQKKFQKKRVVWVEG